MKFDSFAIWPKHWAFDLTLLGTHDICQKYTSMPSEENDSTQNTQIASLSNSYGNSVNVFDIISTE